MGFAIDHNDAPLRHGRHRERAESFGPCLHGRSWSSEEPDVDFDWEGVEDRTGEVAEYAGITMVQAAKCLEFLERKGGHDRSEVRLLFRVMSWIARAHPLMDRLDGDGGRSDGKGAGDERISLRFIAAMRAMHPDSRIAKMTSAQIAHAFGVSDHRIRKLKKQFLDSFK